MKVKLSDNEGAPTPPVKKPRAPRKKAAATTPEPKGKKVVRSGHVMYVEES